MKKMRGVRLGRCVLVVGVVLLTLPWGAAPVVAQDPAGKTGEQDRLELRTRIQARIDEATGLGQVERQRMEENLRRSVRLELRDDQIEGLFPDPARGAGVPAPQLLALQDRVIATGESGLAADLLADKVREGRMKRADAAAIERAVERLEQHLRLAERQMLSAREGGVAAAGDPAVERRLQRGLALDLWRGLQQGDLDRLRQRAEDRARDGSCSIVELAAAAETATELLELSPGDARALEIAGAGLSRGLSAAEIRQLGQLARTASRRGESPGPLLDAFQRQLRAGATMDAMLQHMLQHGWLGPRDMGGPAGQSPVDNVIDGPGRQGGTQGSGGNDSPGTGTGTGKGGR